MQRNPVELTAAGHYNAPPETISDVCSTSVREMYTRLPIPRRRMAVILGSLFLISVVTYIDRVNISVTARQMMPAFGLTDQEMGRVFSAFVVGYALCQIPGGWIGDRWGARVVLTGALIWWSLFTGITALAAVLPWVSLTGVMGSLLVIRFMLGIGEAVALPNFNRAVAAGFLTTGVDWGDRHRHRRDRLRSRHDASARLLDHGELGLASRVLSLHRAWTGGGGAVGILGRN